MKQFIIGLLIGFCIITMLGIVIDIYQSRKILEAILQETKSNQFH